MLDAMSLDELLARVDEIVDVLSEYEEQCYIPLEIAQQLQDELRQIIPEDDDD